MLDFLNDFSGLFSLLAVVASVAIPFLIYKMQRKNEKVAERNRILEELQNAEDELDSLREHIPFPLSESQRAKQTRISYLEKRLNRKK